MEPIEPTKEVRRGLWERIKGKTKKVAGAATGSEGLIAEGELHEIAADKHMEAAERKARADELRDAATERFFETQQELEQVRSEVRAEEELREEAVERAANNRKAAAEKRGQERAGARRATARGRREAAAALENVKREIEKED